MGLKPGQVPDMASGVREIRGNKTDLTFFFNLTPINVDLYLICSFVLVSVRAHDSVMTYTYSISVLFHFFVIEVIGQSCWGPQFKALWRECSLLGPSPEAVAKVGMSAGEGRSLEGDTSPWVFAQAHSALKSQARRPVLLKVSGCLRTRVGHEEVLPPCGHFM